MIERLFVGVITGEYARRADFYDYLDILEKPPGTVGWKCHDRSPAKGRNLIVTMARKHGCSHILFLDDDMVPRPEVINQLAEHDVDIVSGLYLGRNSPHIPFVFSHFVPEGAVARGLNRDDPRLLPIAAAGMGCCLVRMTVFDRLAPPYFRLGELNPEEWSDDLGFFKRVQMAGVQAYCDLECRVGHIGTLIVWPDRQADGWRLVYDTNGGKENMAQRLDAPAGSELILSVA